MQYTYTVLAMTTLLLCKTLHHVTLHDTQSHLTVR